MEKVYIKSQMFDKSKKGWVGGFYNPETREGALYWFPYIPDIYDIENKIRRRGDVSKRCARLEERMSIRDKVYYFSLMDRELWVDISEWPHYISNFKKIQLMESRQMVLASITRSAPNMGFAAGSPTIEAEWNSKYVTLASPSAPSYSSELTYKGIMLRAYGIDPFKLEAGEAYLPIELFE